MIAKLTFFLLLAAPLLFAQNSQVCPAAMTPKGAKTPHAFQRVSLFNLDKDGKEYELAPDSDDKRGAHVVQIWKVKDYRDMPLKIRCRYRQTDETTTVDAPQQAAACTFRFDITAKGEIVGKPSFTCQ